MTAPEADPYDVAQQAADAVPADPGGVRDVPLEADPYDAAEQGAVVELDEDEGR